MIAQALRLECTRFCGSQRGQEERCKNRNDGDHDQQLDQCESGAIGFHRLPGRLQVASSEPKLDFWGNPGGAHGLPSVAVTNFSAVFSPNSFRHARFFAKGCAKVYPEVCRMLTFLGNSPAKLRRNRLRRYWSKQGPPKKRGCSLGVTSCLRNWARVDLAPCG